MSLDKVIARIRKLRALSTSSNVNEAAAAAAEAQRLMTEHQLEEAKIEQAVEEIGEEPMPRVKTFHARRVTWRAILLNTVAKINACLAVFDVHNSDKPPLLIGRRERRQAAIYLFTMYEQEVRRLARANGFRVNTRVGMSFCFGAVEVIVQRLQEARQAEEARFRAAGAAAERALTVVRDAEIEVALYGRQKHRVHDGYVSGNAPDALARMAGQQAGRSVPLGHAAQQLPGAPLRLGAGK